MATDKKKKEEEENAIINLNNSRKDLNNLYLGLKKQDEVIEEALKHLKGIELIQGKEFQRDFAQIKRTKFKGGDVDSLLKAFQKKWAPLATK